MNIFRLQQLQLHCYYLSEELSNMPLNGVKIIERIGAVLAYIDKLQIPEHELDKARYTAHQIIRKDDEKTPQQRETELWRLQRAFEAGLVAPRINIKNIEVDIIA